MRTNLLRSFFVVFACWYSVALLFWGFADPPQNAAVQARAHDMLPWIIPAPPAEVGILNAWQVQLTVFKTWSLVAFLLALASIGLGVGLAYLKIDGRLKAIRSREQSRGDYRGMKVTLGELPPPVAGAPIDELEIDHEDPLFQQATPQQRALFNALAGYLSSNPQVPSQAGKGVSFLEEALERAEVALRVRKTIVAALIELGYATGRVGMHHRECNPYKPGERVGFAKTQGYYAAKVIGALSQWYALDEATRTEVLFGAKYYENPKARPYRMGTPPPVPATPLPPAPAAPTSAVEPAPPVAPAPSAPPPVAAVAAPTPSPSPVPVAPPAPVPVPAAPSTIKTEAPPLPPPAAPAVEPVASPVDAVSDGGLLQASFFRTPPTASFTIEDHLVRSGIPLLKGIEWGHAKVARHEYQSETNPSGRPLPFGWRHGKYILLLSNRLEEYLRLRLPAPMVDEADATPAPAELQRRGLKVSGLMAAFMRGLAKYEILHTELELDKPKGHICRAAMPEVSLWTVKVGKARFKQVIVLRLRKSFVEHVTDEDGNFKDGMTVLDCYLPDKPIPAEVGVTVTPAITDGVSLADAVGMGLFKAAAPAKPAAAPAATPEPPRAAPAAPAAPPVQSEVPAAPANPLEDLFNAPPQDAPAAAPPVTVPAAGPSAPATADSKPRHDRRPKGPRDMSPLEAAGLAPKKKSRHEP